MQFVGIAVIIVGLILILLGVVFAWGEFQQRRTLGATEFVQAIRDLVIAIGQSRNSASIACFSFGTILVVIGGVIAGVAGLL